jgi:hypothetical protein
MYTIERRQSGYLLTFSGKIGLDEMQRWHDESERKLACERERQFGVIVDMRALQPLAFNVKELMIRGQRLYKEKGMHRSAVILSAPEICRQFKSLAIQSGIYATERYIDASQDARAIERAILWVKDAIDPDREHAAA